MTKQTMKNGWTDKDLQQLSEMIQEARKKKQTFFFVDLYSLKPTDEFGLHFHFDKNGAHSLEAIAHDGKAKLSNSSALVIAPEHFKPTN